MFGAYSMQKFTFLFILFYIIFLSCKLQAQNIQATPRAGCAPLVSLFSVNVANPTAYAWNFGDGSVSNLASPGKIYNTPGTYTVSVTITFANNTQITIIDTNLITVFPNPNPTFTVTIDTITACDITQKVLITPTILNNGNNYIWDFGDGQSGFNPTPLHTYRNNGTYNIISIVTDSNGCQAVDSQLINITVRLPVFARFSLSDSNICNPFFGIQTQNTTVGGAGAIRYSWFISPQSTPFSTQRNPRWVPGSFGNFTLSLVARTNQNCTDTFTQTVQVTKKELIGQLFVSDTVVCPGTRVTFSQEDTLQTYRWRIENRAYNGNPVSHAFSQNGLFNVQVVAVDANGCSDTVIFNNAVRVTSDLTAQLSGNPIPGCTYPKQYQFNGRTQAATNFGYFIYRLPGNNNLIGSGNDSIFRFGFPSRGNYKVVFWTSAGDNCFARDSMLINLTDTLPQVTITPSSFAGCLPLTVNFQINTVLPSNVSITNQVFHFGNGQSSSAPNPTHTYNIQGQYEAYLIVQFSNGCRDTVRLPELIRASTKPTANYGPPFFSGCTPLIVRFNNLSTDTFPFTTYEWRFNGSLRSTDKEARIVFPIPGIFDGQLIVDNYGCRDTFNIANNVQVFPPLASFLSNNRQACDTPHTVQFIDQSIGASTWFWDFGDPSSGADNFSTLSNPSHTYRNFGTYDIKLIVTNPNGCIDSILRRRYVVITNPVANFSLTGASGCFPVQVNFRNNSTLGNYLWNFGDGNTSTAVNPTHTYQTPGNYLISLIVTDNNGCSDTSFSAENIDVKGPIVVFGALDTLGCKPFTAIFADSSNTGGNIVSWHWNFGDPTTLADTANIPNPTYTYNQIGSFNVSLTLVDTNGCIASINKTNYIQTVAPIVTFSTPDTIRCIGLPIRFLGQAQSSFGASQFFWDFGDGTTGTGRAPSKTYAQAGLFTVKLIVTDSIGCTDSLIRTNYIRIIDPTPNFGGAPLSGYCAPMQVQFFDSTLFAVGWQWSFGDGSSSILRNPAKVYTRNGYYNVQLIIQYAGGCADTIRRDSMIHILGPIANYSFIQNGNCAPVSVQFSNLSTAFRTSVWDFGNGQFDTTRNPIAIYNQAGSYNPVLLVTDSTGCQDVYDPNPQIVVDSVPTASFAVNADAACASLAASFTDQSTGNPVRWFWDFGNGLTDTIQNPIVAFSPGNYPIKLIVFNIHGCSDTLDRPEPIRVFEPPKAGFIADPNPGCMPQVVNFLDTSVIQRPLVAWYWNFGDPTAGALNESTLQNPTFTYFRNGSYDITLKITDVLGCTDSIFRPQYVVIFDSVAPPNAIIDYVTVDQLQLKLQWQQTNYFRFGAYLIFRKANHPDSAFTLINTIRNIADTVFYDVNVAVNNLSYCYYVLVRDLCGKASNFDPNTVHCSIHLSAVPSSIPAINAVQVRWNPYQGWLPNNYLLYRRAQAEPSFSLLATLPATQTEYLDVSLCQGIYEYFVEATLNARNLKSTSNQASASPNYNFPSRPLNIQLVTVQDDAYLRLNWSKSGTRNVQNYIINRISDNGNTRVNAFATLPPTDTTFNDFTANPHAQWYQYEVFEVDSCGNQSPIGYIGRSIHLTSNKADFEIFLQWNPYLEWPEGVAFYQIERQNPTTLTWENIGATQAGVRRYHDVFNNSSFPEYVYRVWAHRNNNPNIRSLSNTTRQILPTTIFVPNAFTPNNNGVNDYFEIKGLHLAKFELYIFDRWGQEVFRSNNAQIMWDGTIKGEPAMPGTFAWILRIEGFDGTQDKLHGVVHLIR